MATAHDVAAYILRERGGMSAMKLQKLVYYCQAWSLVWEDRPIFQEPIEAWVNGPVVRDLYAIHKGRFSVDDWPIGDPNALSAADRETIDVVLSAYADHSAQYLSDLTHQEAPWREAREGLSDDAATNREITLESMMEYYSSLPPNGAEA